MQLMRWFVSGMRGNWCLMSLYTLSSFGMVFPMVSIASLLNREVGLSQSDMMVYYSLIFIPWNLRCVYGMISDSVPVFGFRRRPYIVSSNFIVGSLFIVYGLTVDSFISACCIGIILNVFCAVSEAVIDAVSVERVTALKLSPHTATIAERSLRSSDIQSCNMMCRTVGSMISCLIAGQLSTIPVFTPRVLISMTSVFPFISSIISLFASQLEGEYAQDKEQGNVFIRTKELMRYFWDCLRYCKAPVAFVATVGPVLVPSIFILIYASCPNSNVAYSSYLYTSKSWLTESDFNILLQLETVGSLLGTMLYWIIFRKTQDIRYAFAASIVASAIATMTRLLVVYGWADSFWFICLDGAMVSVVSRVVLMPVQVYASIAASTPEYLMYEGFVFGFFASIENWGGTISGLIASEIVQHVSLAHFIIICSGISLFPLLLLSCLSSKRDSKPTIQSTACSEQGQASVDTI